MDGVDEGTHSLIGKADVVGGETPAEVVGIDVVFEGEDTPDQRIVNATPINSPLSQMGLRTVIRTYTHV